MSKLQQLLKEQELRDDWEPVRLPMSKLQQLLKSQEECEWIPCDQEAKYSEASGDGRIVNVCLAHRRLLRKQKQLQGNI